LSISWDPGEGRKRKRARKLERNGLKATMRESSGAADIGLPCIDRRSFVASAAAFSLGSMLTGCASIAAIPVTPEQGRVRLRFLHHPALLEPGGSVRIRPEGESSPVYVLALEDGGFAALSPICTHQGCTVDIAARYLVCPCHGSTYERDGTVVRGPAPASLRRFPVERTDDGLLIDLGGVE
jgi:Rieske Fe-S protein